jgi:hypothetical protein
MLWGSGDEIASIGGIINRAMSSIGVDVNHADGAIDAQAEEAAQTAQQLSKESWLVAGIIPGVEHQPLKKLRADENDLLKFLKRWRSGEGRLQDQPHCRRLRSWPRRVLAGALAEG